MKRIVTFDKANQPYGYAQLDADGKVQSTASYALTASYAINVSGGSTDTGSLLVTASVSSNTITFSKGDSTTFSITVDTGSVDLSSYITNAQTSSMSVATASFATSASWAPMRPGGSDTHMQFNSGSTLSGNSNLRYNYTNSRLILTGSLNVSGSGTYSNGLTVTSSLIITGSEPVVFSTTGDILEISGSFILYGSASISDGALFEGPVTMENNAVVSGSLEVYGQGVFTNGLNVSSSLTVSGSTTITNVLTLPYQDPLPNSPATGSIALSGSGAVFVGMFVWTGQWEQI